MDYQKFIKQLPELYNNWGQESLQPKSEQFQQVLDQVQGMTTANIMQLLNFAVACLEPGEIYCEIGCGQGVTLIGALLNHPEQVAYAVDNFLDLDVSGNPLENLTDNLAQFHLEEQVVFCNQDFEDFFIELRELDLKNKIGLYLYNGRDDYRSVLLSLLLVKPFLADKAFSIITNNTETVEQAVWDFLATNTECKFLSNAGIYILSLDINNRELYNSNTFKAKRNQLVIQAIQGSIFSNFIWEKLNLGWQLRSGLIVKIQSLAEWVIYNDIFVDGEYDFPIKKAIASAPQSRPLNVLDLGANVGFFTWRVADLILQSKRPQLPLKVTLVEGSPTVYRKLDSRLVELKSILDNKLNFELKVVHGLIGDRQGTGKIFEVDFHGMNSIFSKEESGGVEVPFINLTSLYEEKFYIDLLKCDIEGSELSFLKNYKDLLYRVKKAVFEFHPTYCDKSQCFDILREAGFTNNKILKEAPTYSVHFFWK